MKRIAIIGAGAAGCFCAQRLRELCPEASVRVYESHTRPLAKVAVTGGGRCNLTNTFAHVQDLRQVYPRGHQQMKKMMHLWSQKDTITWFENQGVRLITQPDQCIFPKSQNAMEIVATLSRHIDIQPNTRITKIKKTDKATWHLFTHDQVNIGEYDIVVVTTGGARTHTWLEDIGIEIVKPEPSLFPLKLIPTGLEQMTGAVVQDVTLTLPGTTYRARGTMLVTHTGISGPAVLRLSSYAARHLAEHKYNTDIIINWTGDTPEEQVRDTLRHHSQQHPDKLITTIPPTLDGGKHPFTTRMWEYIIERTNIPPDIRWKGVSKKQYNKLASLLTSDKYHVTGREPHKEEFVTSGGVALTALHPQTLESKTHPRLYFAGEVTDIDGVTGGYNLQAAWTTAEVVAQAISKQTNH